MNIIKKIRNSFAPSKKGLYAKLDSLNQNFETKYRLLDAKLNWIAQREELLFWFLKQKPGKSIQDTQLEFYKNLGKENKHFKNIQTIILSIMKFYNQVCRNNNLDYWLWSGTLLGAERHEGFIPWDEDADVGMLRTDFEKLKKIINCQTRYKLVDFYEVGIRYNSCGRFAKLIDTECPFPIYLDIFPFDFEIVDSHEAAAKLYYERRELLQNEIWNKAQELNLKLESRPCENKELKKQIDEIFDRHLNKIIDESLTIRTPNVSLQWGLDLFRAPYIKRWNAVNNEFSRGGGISLTR